MWPGESNIKFSRGIILTSILFFIPLMFVKLGFSLGIIYENPSASALLVFSIFYSLQAPFALGTIHTLGNIDIRKFIFAKLPSWKESIKWGSVGMLWGSINLITNLNNGYHIGKLGYDHLIAAIFHDAIILPIVEEATFRGICFVAIYNYRRNLFAAYIVTSIIFTVAHARSYTEFILNTTLGLSYAHILSIICFSMVTCYIYYSTGKLLLCIWIHGIINSMSHLGILIGYLSESQHYSNPK